MAVPDVTDPGWTYAAFNNVYVPDGDNEVNGNEAVSDVTITDENAVLVPGEPFLANGLTFTYLDPATTVRPNGDTATGFVASRVEGGETGYYFFSKSPDFPNGRVTVDSGSGDTPICFMPGTLLRTDAGEVPVEALQPGDLVLTADGRLLPVLWIGRQTVVARFADPVAVLPVRVRAGALAEGVPARDLLVSPAHALLVDGVLAEAGALVNGSTITRERDVPARFAYHHVELAEHALLLAEGAPAESFDDTSERARFDNGAAREALAAGRAPIPEMTLPRARSQRQVPRAIRERLAARAEAVLGRVDAAA
jgi:hypothetical protein